MKNVELDMILSIGLWNVGVTYNGFKNWLKNKRD